MTQPERRRTGASSQGAASNSGNDNQPGTVANRTAGATRNDQGQQQQPQQTLSDTLWQMLTRAMMAYMVFSVLGGIVIS